ncbi:hypothetical protein [Streptomyces sp. DH8]|uniref:hypothetical protein n=1 Tax=Streptomyces sp. DH8 TaxID=2857008 RepID=UPI001E65DBD0|nr:hypothetical protein [Streptomyces sp. DH8]
MAEIEIPESLLVLERAAWAEQREGRLTLATAEAVQRAVREHAAAAKVSRLAVEMEMKRLVRHEEG